MFAWILSLLTDCLRWLQQTLFRKALTFPVSQISVSVLTNQDSSLNIGEGAFSVVLKAKDRSTDRYYALKKMLLQSPECVAIAKNEIDAFRRFRHNHILALVDSVESTEQGRRVMYLLLPFCAQGSLRTVLTAQLQQGGGVVRLPLREVLYQFKQICEALLVLHTFSPAYVHQDIKPDNVLVDEQGRVFLTDFGSVRKADVAINSRSDSLRVADEAAQFCTASYRSPELYDPPKGYSPYECEFAANDRVKVVECTTLRILSAIPRKARASPDDLLIYELCEWILNQQICQRPFLVDVVTRVAKLASSSTLEAQVSAGLA